MVLEQCNFSRPKQLQKVTTFSLNLIFLPYFRESDSSNPEKSEKVCGKSISFFLKFQATLLLNHFQNAIGFLRVKSNSVLFPPKESETQSERYMPVIFIEKFFELTITFLNIKLIFFNGPYVFLDQSHM